MRFKIFTIICTTDEWSSSARRVVVVSTRRFFVHNWAFAVYFTISNCVHFLFNTQNIKVHFTHTAAFSRRISFNVFHNKMIKITSRRFACLSIRCEDLSRFTSFFTIRNIFASNSTLYWSQPNWVIILCKIYIIKCTACSACMCEWVSYDPITFCVHWLVETLEIRIIDFV